LLLLLKCPKGLVLNYMSSITWETLYTTIGLLYLSVIYRVNIY
jgi:hypothetical protein